jgi:hypothetical protein
VGDLFVWQTGEEGDAIQSVGSRVCDDSQLQTNTDYGYSEAVPTM